MPWNREQLLALAALSGRAPSPHNIQPARWRFADERVELWEDPARWLSVGDPSGRDNRIALGMAWEGMAIALSGEGHHLALETQFSPGYPPPQSGLRLVSQGRLSPGATVDALLPALDTRRSYRGRFAPADADQARALDACIAAYGDTAFALPESAATPIAEWYDLAAAEGLDSPAFAGELYRWMRFSPRDSRWARDGLSANCMSLSGFEAWGASFALKPAAVRVLSALSLTRFLVSEADKIKSASRLVLIHAPTSAAAFDTGRAWYRFWLALDRAGFAGVPMSSLPDSPGYSRKLLDVWPLPSGRSLVNVMRIGPVPPSGSIKSARLPAAELLLN